MRGNDRLGGNDRVGGNDRLGGNDKCCVIPANAGIHLVVGHGFPHARE